jgi:hypothetical protein
MNRRGFLLCCSAPLVPRLAPPDPASDEGGLWALMQHEEERLRRSAFVIRDRALNEYVNGIACRLAAGHCPDIRVYLVRTPHFNATMAANGMVQVSSGLLLRMANEAQLAAVLAHEIGHYLARHGVERLRDATSRSGLGQVLSILLSPAAFLGSALSSVAQMGLAAGGLAYARDQEREADRLSVALMSRAGYDATQAALVWSHLDAEAAEERAHAVAALAAELPGPGRLGAEEYRAALQPHRARFLHDEVQRRRFGETLALFERLAAGSPGDGELGFFRGEAHRLRAGEGDLNAALDFYLTARTQNGAPAELYRSMGLVLRHLGRPGEASSAFARYLELRPAAVDIDMVRSYL